ncbi:MAG: hypothetical protein E6Q92_03750 [Burkholderiaceae bacterium]|nr:MAG: hypothetical protein E6Q92_03750 [Burkholderiaceae bacterium]
MILDELASAAKATLVVDFLNIWLVFVLDENRSSLLLLVLTFSIGVFFRRKVFFRGGVIFCAAMSFMCSFFNIWRFGVKCCGVLYEEAWLNVEMSLFVMWIFSEFLAFLAGLRSENNSIR